MENNLKKLFYIYTYIYIKLNHCAVHLKLMQYCKSSILQLKKQSSALISNSQEKSPEVTGVN